VKTVEGASNFKSVASLQQILGDQMRKQPVEKWWNYWRNFRVTCQPAAQGVL